MKEPKNEEGPSSDSHVQMNIEDLAEHFKHLKLKLGEHGGQQSQPPKMQAAMYCIMCGKSGHGIHECSESKFFITQDICRMDINNRIVMSNGTALLHTEGEGGAAKQIHDHLSSVGGIIVWYPACLYSQVLMPAVIQQFSTPIQRFLIRNPVSGQHSYIHSQYSIFQIHSKPRRNYAIE